MTIQNISNVTGKLHTMELDVTIEQLQRFQNRRQTGEHVQTIFPNLSRAEREFLLTGITPTEWESLFGKGE